MSEPTTNIDIREKGRSESGEVIALDRRLFMQLLAFSECTFVDDLAESLAAENLPVVLYVNINDPQGVGLLAFHEDPDFFVTRLRDYLNRSPFAALTPLPEMTMLGRTYSLGYEPDLERTLITRPIEKVCDPAMPWAIWYPLRRKGLFEQATAEEQRTMLMEHGGIGRAYARAGHGTDIRLASHGLDKNDNDFTVALLGPDLYPLSTIVQRMRKTVQTSQYLERLGPFFIGKAAWQCSR
ncbi:MAG: chlorite dismutase family protein [Caldilineales bacterium]|nr:chlorite dismutase family protein [Caldilineales bacterium]